jgi:hypothetical protein
MSPAINPINPRQVLSIQNHYRHQVTQDIQCGLALNATFTNSDTANTVHLFPVVSSSSSLLHVSLGMTVGCSIQILFKEALVLYGWYIYPQFQLCVIQKVDKLVLIGILLFTPSKNVANDE